MTRTAEGLVCFHYFTSRQPPRVVGCPFLTALHLACAFGHPEVVTLLAEKKCQMNFGDNRNRTALMKAVQCQEEECATILLKHGADPHVKDFRSNTALHYAARGQNTAIAEQLLQHQADMEATNEFDFTPLLVAVRKNRQKMVEFLLERHANIHAVDKWKRTALILAVKDTSSNTVRLLLQEGVDVFARDCIGWTAEDHGFNRGLKANAILISDFKKERCKKSSDNNSRALQESAKEESIKRNLSTVVDECSKCDPASSLTCKPGTNDSRSVSADGLFDVDTKKEATKLAIGKRENRVDIIESAPQDQTSNDNLTCVEGAHQNNISVKKSSLGLGQEEDVESPWHSETSIEVKDPVPNKAVGMDDVQTPRPGTLCNTNLILGRNLSAGQHLGMTSEEGQARLDGNEKNYTHVVQEENDTQRPLFREQDNRILHDAILTNCLQQQKETEINLKKMNSEVSESYKKEKDLLRENHMLQDEIAKLRLQMDTLKTQNQEMEKKYFVDFTPLLSAVHKKSQKMVEFLLERHANIHAVDKWKRTALMIAVKDKSSNTVRPLLQAGADISAQDVRGWTAKDYASSSRLKASANSSHLGSIGSYNRYHVGPVVQSPRSPEPGAPEARVSESYKKEKDLLRENHMLQDEIAKLRLQMDTLNTQNQEVEKKYFEDTANAKEKNDCLQKTIKLNDETLTKTVFEYNRQLNVPTAENTMLNSQLENERQSKERLKTEAESDHHYELSKQLIRHLQHTFQRLRDECLHFMDKIAMCNLKEKKEILSQQLSKAGSKFNSLDTELPHTRYAVRERTLVFEPVLKDLNQTQCQEEEFEHMYQREQGKVNTYIGKLESLKEKGSDVQSGNMLLRQQLDDAFNKSDSNENSGMNIEEQLQELKKVLQAECEKQERMVKERHKELVNKLKHLKERMCQYENDKSEREVVGRQLQQELPDSIKKLPVSEASLEVRLHYRMRSEAETQDFKTLEHIRSQLQEARARHTEDARCSEKMEDHVQKLETENTDLKMTIKKPVGLIKQLHRNLSGTSLSEDEKEQLKYYKKLTESLQYNLNQQKKKNDGLEKEFTRLKTLFQNTRMLHDNQNGELSFLGGLEPSQSEMDIQMNRLKQKEQAASQENVDPLNDHDDASISDMEVRIQRRESELPKVKTSRDSFK
ncbi:LOW QUALITY PROTEIN: ankyrin repeat domain-containing protein 18A-like [Rhinolophus ferrumequinum]|uniref:LOW QUALITY PROTEIN: ankyrin repeat domain-containing protein 18A-like n=1 Tax=Rhinolophus ferrumequinum TaxID=59479 RepID=UPI00140F8B77|nr:LOW QUALITY PROTEIN: ankyrin repeat domain-containing protein 18A-like [Rhinolophus ferrumequinum]